VDAPGRSVRCRGDTATDPSVPTAARATIATTDNDDYGKLMTDGERLTLYVFFEDDESSSTCYDACADNWPPLLTAGEPQAEGDVDSALLGTAERKDGSTQVTYDGQPLYYYSDDTAPGDVLGFDSGNVWYPVAPDGAPIDIAANRSEDDADGGY
jgi:predicted lipoprotein with Yx(FWY)xxD motif